MTRGAWSHVHQCKTEVTEEHIKSGYWTRLVNVPAPCASLHDLTLHAAAQTGAQPELSAAFAAKVLCSLSSSGGRAGPHRAQNSSWLTERVEEHHDLPLMSPSHSWTDLPGWKQLKITATETFAFRDTQVEWQRQVSVDRCFWSSWTLRGSAAPNRFQYFFLQPQGQFLFYFPVKLCIIKKQMSPCNPEEKRGRYSLRSYFSLCPCTSIQYSWVSNLDTCMSL